ncbi:MAG TPA: hypothetical protein VGE29_20895 [Prosthecobacter sp.]
MRLKLESEQSQSSRWLRYQLRPDLVASEDEFLALDTLPSLQRQGEEDRAMKYEISRQEHIQLKRQCDNIPHLGGIEQ